LKKTSEEAQEEEEKVQRKKQFREVESGGTKAPEEKNKVEEGEVTV